MGAGNPAVATLGHREQAGDSPALSTPRPKSDRWKPISGPEKVPKGHIFLKKVRFGTVRQPFSHLFSNETG